MWGGSSGAEYVPGADLSNILLSCSITGSEAAARKTEATYLLPLAIRCTAGDYNPTAVTNAMSHTTQGWSPQCVTSGGHLG